jgi:hypothetical protein
VKKFKTGKTGMAVNMTSMHAYEIRPRKDKRGVDFDLWRVAIRQAFREAENDVRRVQLGRVTRRIGRFKFV